MKLLWSISSTLPFSATLLKSLQKKPDWNYWKYICKINSIHFLWGNTNMAWEFYTSFTQHISSYAVHSPRLTWGCCFKAGSCIMRYILHFYSSGFSLWLRWHKFTTASKMLFYLLGEWALGNKGINFFCIVWKFNVIIAMMDKRDMRSARTVKCFIRRTEVVGRDTNFWYCTFCIVASMYSFKNVSRLLTFPKREKMPHYW